MLVETIRDHYNKFDVARTLKLDTLSDITVCHTEVIFYFLLARYMLVVNITLLTSTVRWS